MESERRHERKESQITQCFGINSKIQFLFPKTVEAYGEKKLKCFEYVFVCLSSTLLNM